MLEPGQRIMLLGDAAPRVGVFQVIDICVDKDKKPCTQGTPGCVCGPLTAATPTVAVTGFWSSIPTWLKIVGALVIGYGSYKLYTKKK